LRPLSCSLTVKAAGALTGEPAKAAASAQVAAALAPAAGEAAEKSCTGALPGLPPPLPPLPPPPLAVAEPLLAFTPYCFLTLLLLFAPAAPGSHAASARESTTSRFPIPAAKMSSSCAGLNAAALPAALPPPPLALNTSLLPPPPALETAHFEVAGLASARGTKTCVAFTESRVH
jgi:hypothetical protein